MCGAFISVNPELFSLDTDRSRLISCFSCRSRVYLPILYSSDPYTNASYGGSLGNPPIPISSAYNSTNGTFCVTSVLTQLSAYFGANLTLPYLESFIGAGSTTKNTTALTRAENISTTILCNPCIFAALDLTEEVYPSLGLVTVSSIYGLLNMSTPTSVTANTTINTLVNSTCAYDALVVTSSK